MQGWAAETQHATVRTLPGACNGILVDGTSLAPPHWSGHLKVSVTRKDGFFEVELTGHGGFVVSHLGDGWRAGWISANGAWLGSECVWGGYRLVLWFETYPCDRFLTSRTEGAKYVRRTQCKPEGAVRILEVLETVHCAGVGELRAMVCS